MAYRTRSSRRLPFEKSKKVAQGRSKPNQEFYNSWSWRQYSIKWRKANRLCKLCNRIVIDIKDAVCDHIISINLAGSKWDPRNHQTAHKDCHNSKSAAESRGLIIPFKFNEQGEKIPA